MSTNWPEGSEVAEAYEEKLVIRNGFVVLESKEAHRKYDDLLDRLNV